MNRPHILDSAADWAAWYREQNERQATVIREVYKLDLKSVIALPPDTLQRLLPFVSLETECAQCGSVCLCCDDGEAYVCVDEDECRERQQDRDEDESRRRAG